ncbi:hypothetical protein [Anaerophaga thermohalophila]|uniref:hypothetical protein n=1 Tax=Anaerophaga thermohalophila TaxID=177400 RepID=UPI0003792182|nr:hypothetical protein [Anaerophaga thermohalophila]
MRTKQAEVLSMEQRAWSRGHGAEGMEQRAWSKEHGTKQKKWFLIIPLIPSPAHQLTSSSKHGVETFL